jgi:hypothetical protein
VDLRFWELQAGRYFVFSSVIGDLRLVLFKKISLTHARSMHTQEDKPVQPDIPIKSIIFNDEILSMELK